MKYLLLILLIACTKPVPICTTSVQVSILLENQETLSHIEVEISTATGIKVADIFHVEPGESHTYENTYRVDVTEGETIYCTYRVFDSRDGSYFTLKDLH